MHRMYFGVYWHFVLFIFIIIFYAVAMLIREWKYAISVPVTRIVVTNREIGFTLCSFLMFWDGLWTVYDPSILAINGSQFSR